MNNPDYASAFIKVQRLQNQADTLEVSIRTTEKKLKCSWLYLELKRKKKEFSVLNREVRRFIRSQPYKQKV
jgi:hypothetical protein